MHAVLLPSLLCPERPARLLPIRMSASARDETGPLAPEDLDIDLMGRVRRADMAAFERLVEIHQHRVVGTVARMIGDDQDAEDIAQQVFLRVWKSADRYRPTAKFTTWLFTITRNLVFNELRRRRRHPADSLDADLTPDSSARSIRESDTRNPDQVCLDREMQDAIQQAIDQLPEPQRLAIILRRYEELPYEEIATVLETTVPAVKSLLFRARGQLRESLSAYLRD